jgi:hypothetical protein
MRRDTVTALVLTQFLVGERGQIASGDESEYGGSVTLFGFDGGSYRSTLPAAMQAGKGYWARFQSPASVTITTSPAPLLVPLVAGWNLIGNATPTRTSLPAGKVAFSWDGLRYRSCEALEPGEGAWVRAAQAEEFVLAPLP